MAVTDSKAETGSTARTVVGPGVAGDTRPRGRRWRDVVDRHAAQLIIVAAWLVLLVVFAVSNPYFLLWSNLSGLLLASAVTGIMALGLTFVIATGGIDLTPGLGMALTGVITALLVTSAGLPLWLSVLGGILAGTALGAVNGFLVARLRMQPMIATLAMMLVAQGLALVLSGASPIYLNTVAGFSRIALGTPLGIPNAVLILLVADAVAHVVLTRTLVGRYALAIGSNEEATRLSGVNVVRWKWLVYALGGTFTGLAGVVMASRLDSAQPAIGIGYEMYAIAAAVLGGASLRGGRANVLGSVVGAFVITTVQNGLQLNAVPDQWQKIVLGVIVLLAVYLDVRRTRKNV